MNFVLLFLLLSLAEDAPMLPGSTRADRRASRSKAIAHNRKLYNDLVGGGIWFETKRNGVYTSYHNSQVHTKSQKGRWETTKLSGHRRYQKWCRDAYPSFTDEKAIRRANDALKDYFES